ncbi:ATP-grasp domain-containing protein [Winogradskyella sp. UBA3174]|mgnify:CR=1 FL=1|uniref:ATP-grasp domain-containing protein n=1 Tax=Winogradskyella sp. UBA3174 TaxID=1947785 RepID=UPI0025D1D131|nr:ATP-grasp domain-containing protein [Winogradskyella sp. UBA3174]|tara:strand:+ start:40961 stop:41932 length:972 start_codon:yes stop_codon:yes gene_type:complete
MNILITSAGRRVSLVRAFKKELTKINSVGKVYAADFNPKLSAACHVADDYFKVPRLDQVNYLDKLISICLENGIKLIIPTIDTELLLLSENMAYLESKGIRVVISSSDFIRKCRNKRVIHEFFELKGVRIAKEYRKDNYELPMFIKPYDGSRSVDTYLINSESDLTSYHFSNEKFMFLEYIDHDEFDEFTCDLYYSRDHQLRCVVPRKRLEVRDGEVYKALTKNNTLVNYIKKHLNQIDGAVGCITAQFFLSKYDDSKICAIEINPRFGGGYPLSYLSGANFPKWIIEEYLLNKSIDDKFDTWESDLLMIRYDDEILVHGYKD